MNRIIHTTALAALIVVAQSSLLAAEPVKLTFATWAFAGSNLNAMKRVIAQFEQSHPDITVQVEPESPAKYVTQIAAGAGPDIMEVPYGDFAAMAQSGALLNLDSFIKGDPQVDPSDIFPPAWAAVTHDGIRYGMPFDLSAIWMAFMPKHFAAGGVQSPIAAYQQGAWNWDALQSDAKKLTVSNASGKLTQIGMILDISIMEAPWIYQTGTTPFTQDLKHARLSDPRIVQALQFLSGMGQDHIMMRRHHLPGGLSGLKGDFGVWIQWLSIPYAFKGSSVHADIVPMAEGPVGHVDTGQIHSITVWSQTKHPKEAWEFVSFLTGKVGYRNMIDVGFAPIRKSLAPDYVNKLTNQLGVSGAALFTQDIGRLRLYQVPPNWSRIGPAVEKGLAPMWDGKESAKSALEGIQTTVEGLLTSPK